MLTLLQEKLPALTGAQHAMLLRYYALIVEGNKRVNLTAITDAAEVVDKHFCDSLLAEAYIEHNARCIDIGTGAGFPGVPLLIARPDIHMTLLDSLQKRVRFLEETLGELGLLANVVHARAEDAAKMPAHREQYDIALSRAVAPLPVLLELCVPFVRVGGCTLCMIPCHTEYGARNIIRAKKIKPTPPRYPRKAGEPARKPL
ncbi:16S rRNA (guanine(527)-N(7))-methyltransferase RsmG [Christensenellaceae bacterium OttesenSCG-928-L17]|nr:16S rRNA (guanine(527)-N(7))-methyltransferase RsmG [Christensenellaceae bacterium OttesenSCG-928-L17]